MTAQDPDADVRRLSGEAARDGDPTSWFEQLYADAAQGHAIVPWDRRAPHPLLVDWVERQPATSGLTLVVGSGLGDDAAFLAAHGYRVIAFDISRSAIESARRRFPTSPVDFRIADLLNPPAEWRQHFDLVVETYTTQSLPVRLRPIQTRLSSILAGQWPWVLPTGPDPFGLLHHYRCQPSRTRAIQVVLA